MSVLDAIDGMHQQAGRLIAQHWGLSPDIAAVVDHHHGFDPNRSDIPLLTAVLCVAEHMAADLNREIMDTATNTHPHFDRHAPGRYPLALKRLKLEGKEAEWIQKMAALSARFPLSRIEIRAASLEQIFVELYGEETEPTRQEVGA